MEILKNFSDVANIEKRVFYYLCGFSIFIPLSKAVGNIFLALAILGFIHRLFRKNDDVKIIFHEYKKIFASIAFLLAAIFISALTSADILYGLKKFLEKYILHVAAMLPVLLICDKKKIFMLAVLLLFGTFFSNLIVIGEGILNFDKVWRFGGTLTSMSQGSLIAVALPVYAVLIMHVKDKKFFIVAAVVGFLAMLFNGTRGVWIETIILIPVVVLIYSKNKLKSFGIVLLILAIAGGIFAATPNLSKRFSSISNLRTRSVTERFLMWDSAFNMFKDNPVFGVGYGQYKFAYQNEYISPKAREKTQEHAHNNVIQMLAECGIVGAAAFIFLWGYFSYFSLKMWRSEKNFVWLLFFCILWGTMLHGMTEFNFETSVTSKIFWYSLGMCIAYSRIEKKLASGDLLK